MRFVAPYEIGVGEETLPSDLIFLNVGGRAVVPDLPGVQGVPFLTNSSILDLQDLPRHLVIVGGGYIGLEFAQMFRRFGSAVTVVEHGPQLLGHEDPDIRDAIRTILEQEGVAFRLGADCIRFEARGADIAVGVSCQTGAPEVVGSHVLLAMGRRPNTDDLGLDRAGIAVDARGVIAVDDTLQTNVPGIYALGDCNGRGAFTHTAFNDFEIVAGNLLDGGSRSLADRVPAYALYIDPPLGRVGMTEADARKAGKPFRVGLRQMTRVGRAVEKGETHGLMKVIVEEGSDLILGAAILGKDGDEAIHGIINMMNAGVTAEAYRRAMPVHPTLSELIPTILGDLGPAG
ncbi:mercuric reductase [Pseudotabrizicola sp. 4114]|uniref:mercuric reductase n=1 Tax=Pseudotabrizicola sp. 4114 TaxID=2817731 RepID=UPI002863FAAA|nr:pyruvate/2-oxoglutarate dehydrogenase complex dihydrolipoamide dehydrogenase (E3) component [Pseudorhodobacter sp. 4114]